jgi:capsular exopolysaccharide synthesis family protein
VFVNWSGFGDVLRRRWQVVFLVVLLGVGAALLVTQFQGRRYESSVRLLVSGSSPGSAGESASHGLAAERARLFAQIATTDAVVASAEQTADGTLHGQVGGSHVAVRASAHGGEPFLTITATADDPDVALAVAKAYPLVLPGELAKLNQLPAVAGGALLTIVTPAARATHPSFPRPLLNIVIGLGAGVLLGLAAAGLREMTGTGLKDARQIRQLARGKVLGVVPAEFGDERLPAASRPMSRRSRGYEEIRAALASSHARSFVVSSAVGGEGRSTMVANLALLFGRAGARVAVVDSDLRQPSLAAAFNVASESGLADVLTGAAAVSDVLQQVPGEQVTVLAGGQVVPDQKAALAFPAMAEVLRTLTGEFDVVIVDAAPVLAGSEALLLGALTDGVLIVARPGRTTRPGLRRTLAAIQRAPVHLLGVVINAAEQKASHAPVEPAASAAAAVEQPSASATPQVPAPPLDQPDPTFTPAHSAQRTPTRSEAHKPSRNTTGKRRRK